MNSHVFDIQPVARFVGSNAAIRRPKEIACFSYDDQHNLRLDESSLRYYYPPRLPADLNKGFDTFEKLDDSGDEHLDALLDTIIDLERRTGNKCEADIVTWRGMMTKKIMTAPFDNMNGYMILHAPCVFEMNATCYQESIFIEENNAYKLSQKESQRNQRMPPGAPSQDMMAFWGYKFETLSLIDEPWDATSREKIEGRENEIVNNKAQYCSVVRTGIGGFKIVLGGEVDAVWDCKPEKKDEPINWGTWDGNICINFTAKLLGWLKLVINDEGLWRIRRQEKSPVIEVFKLEDSGHGGILSQSFVDWRSTT
ncbi:hypothetical protein PAAG_11663 [Paracoccidioides lutzii Pb01]|uniref:Decapping nuclease n=1 Tax=Paracoccidioides lutzii (strain ATCC MYA-826 / Pb01) TaxID=502779 RepID=A0A0A2V6H5_PARBA|nr:hypothetical protein PAAG_11663 [Paracoccidioides lutzii Pb01]KGQ01670.1 hypothetical protein PAAG_11663 [Paracoccidioides lutzii Pb01]